MISFIVNTIITWFIYFVFFIMGNSLGYHKVLHMAGWLNTTVKPWAVKKFKYYYYGKIVVWWQSFKTPHHENNIIAEKIDYYEKKNVGTPPVVKKLE